MKIDFITSSLRCGGAEHVITVLAGEMVKLGNDVRILYFGNEGDPIAYPIPEGVELCYLGNFRLSKLRAGVRLLKETFRRQKTEAAISFFASAQLLARLAAFGKDRPRFYYSVRYDPYLKHGFKEKCYASFAVKSADGVVFQTVGAQAYFSGSIREKSRIILNPLDSASLPARNPEAQTKEIVSVGRLSPEKNQKMLIGAFALVYAKHPDYVLKIYGEGPLRSELEAQIAENGLSASAFLMGNHRDVKEKIADSAAFALTSDHEGLPNALIEAMCMGIPSVSTDCSPGGARTLITEGENGWIVPRGDDKALADRLLAIAEDPERAKEVGARASRLREKTDVTKIAQEWLSFMRETEEKKR